MYRILSILLLVLAIAGVGLAQQPAGSIMPSSPSPWFMPPATYSSAPTSSYFNQYPMNPGANFNMPITASAGMYPTFGSIHSLPAPFPSGAGSSNAVFQTSAFVASPPVSSQQTSVSMQPPSRGGELSYQQAQEYANWQHQQELARRQSHAQQTPIVHQSSAPPSDIASSASMTTPRPDSQHADPKAADKTSPSAAHTATGSTAHNIPRPPPSSSHSTTQLYTPGIKKGPFGPFGPFGPGGPGGPGGPFGPFGPK